MKKMFTLIIGLFLLTGCAQQSKRATGEPTTAAETTAAPSGAAHSDAPLTSGHDSDEAICNAIALFLKGSNEAVRFSEAAQKDLFESSWPEVQCSVEGLLDSPSSFKDLVVKKVGPGKFKYECVCPDHGDRFVDGCTIAASVAPDGKVTIEHVTWDDSTVK